MLVAETTQTSEVFKFLALILAISYINYTTNVSYLRGNLAGSPFYCADWN